MRRARAAAFFTLVCAVGCGGEVSEHHAAVSPSGGAPLVAASARAPAAPASPASASATGEAAALPERSPARSTWVALAVPGYGAAVVVEPPADGRARPLIVATHGAGGRPEAHCARWEEIVGTRAFVACTRGREASTHLPPDERGYFYDGHHELGRELDATLDALAQRYGARLDAKGAVFAGYSQGATMGILALHEKPERAARFGGVVLVEGGTGDWNVALSERMARLGVRRVAFVCGQASCIDAARTSRPWLARAQLPLRIEHAPGAGHTYGGAVAPLVEQAFAWVVEGDARFASR